MYSKHPMKHNRMARQREHREENLQVSAKTVLPTVIGFLAASGYVAGRLLESVAITAATKPLPALAVDRFRAPLPWSSVIVMSTYWAGQLDIALSAIARASTSPALDEGA